VTRNARNNRLNVDLIKQKEDALTSIVLISVRVHNASKIIRDFLAILSLVLAKTAIMAQIPLQRTWSVNNGILTVQYIILGMDVNIRKPFATNIFKFSA